MLKAIVVAALSLPLIGTAVLAQGNPHHYQGGPRSDPHHMSAWPNATDSSSAPSKKQGKVKAGKQYPAHRYQGGPKSQEPHKM